MDSGSANYSVVMFVKFLFGNYQIWEKLKQYYAVLPTSYEM